MSAITDSISEMVFSPFLPERLRSIRVSKAKNVFSEGFADWVKISIIPTTATKRAIEIALSKAGSGDVILVAGKGHEEYQLIGDKKYTFSDELTVKQILGLI